MKYSENFAGCEGLIRTVRLYVNMGEGGIYFWPSTQWINTDSMENRGGPRMKWHWSNREWWRRKLLLSTTDSVSLLVNIVKSSTLKMWFQIAQSTLISSCSFFTPVWMFKYTQLLLKLQILNYLFKKLPTTKIKRNLPNYYLIFHIALH